MNLAILQKSSVKTLVFTRLNVLLSNRTSSSNILWDWSNRHICNITTSRKCSIDKNSKISVKNNYQDFKTVKSTLFQPNSTQTLLSR